MKAKTLLIFGVIAVLLMSTACNSIDYEEINSYDECRFYTAAELEELYYANKDSFKNVADIILESNKLQEWMEERKIYDYQLSRMDQKRFFSDSEWEEIVVFFKTMHVSRIERNHAAGDCILFEFIWQTVDKIETTIFLYYFPNPTEELLEHHSQNWTMTEFYPIDTNWWIRVCVYNMQPYDYGFPWSCVF